MASIFTKIIDREIPGAFAYEDEKCAVFCDIAPLTRGHVLVVPKQEVDHWIDLDDELSEHLFAVAKRIGRAQKEAYGCERIGVVIQGYEVPHVHIHVFPTNEIADFDLSKKGSLDLTPEDFAADAKAIADAL